MLWRVPEYLAPGFPSPTISFNLPPVILELHLLQAAALRPLRPPREEDIVIVHDDVDLPFGKLRIRRGGGHGGHNGIRNICHVLGHGDFTRIKLGIGRPHPDVDTADYVLKKISSAERGDLQKVLNVAVAATECLLSRGASAAMNEFNNCDILDLV